MRNYYFKGHIEDNLVAGIKKPCWREILILSFHETSWILDERPRTALKLKLEADNQEDETKVDKLNPSNALHDIDDIPGIIHGSGEIWAKLNEDFRQYVDQRNGTSYSKGAPEYAPVIVVPIKTMCYIVLWEQVVPDSFIAFCIREPLTEAMIIDIRWCIPVIPVFLCE